MNTKEATLNQVAFWDVKAALEAAYQAGLEAGKQK